MNSSVQHFLNLLDNEAFYMIEVLWKILCKTLNPIFLLCLVDLIEGSDIFVLSFNSFLFKTINHEAICFIMNGFLEIISLISPYISKN